MSVRFKDIVKRISSISSNGEREAWWLLEASCGLSEQHLKSLFVKNNDLAAVLNNRQLANFLAAVDERVDKRKPLQYICADTYFCNLYLKTKPPVLIPRPETEQMVSWLTHQIKTYNEAVSAEECGAALHVDDSTQSDGTMGNFPVHKFNYNWFNSVQQPLTTPIADQDDKNPIHKNKALWHRLNRIKFLDVCTGSGNIALSLAGQFPESEVVGLDIDPVALKLAHLNSKQCGFENVVFYPCDVFKPQANVGSFSVNARNQFDETHPHSLYDIPMLTSLYDVIISNPPYIAADKIEFLQPEVKDWESKIALTPAEQSYTNDSGVAPDFAKKGVWPNNEQVRKYALPFYEKLVKLSPRLLNHVHHNQTKSHIRFPRLVTEIGDEEQAVYVANMMSELFDTAIFLDTQEKPRWVVGFEKSK